MVAFHCTSSLQVQIWEVEKKWSLMLGHCAISSGKFKTREHIPHEALKHFLAIEMTQKMIGRESKMEDCGDCHRLKLHGC